jgi:hypothetical protein
MSGIIHKSAKISLGFQIVTGLIDYYALQFNVPPELYILKQLLEQNKSYQNC